MENTYIISDNSDWIQKIIKQLELPNNQVLFYQEWREDFLFDDWVNINIKPDISYLIIPIELGSNKYNSFEGLRLAMHIRLMKSHVRYLPIIFISNREEWQIRQMLRDNLDKNHLDYLIGTKGTDFLKPNISEIKAVLENIKPLNEEEYKAQFYDHIHLLPLEDDGGKHSLANIWGAIRLNEVLHLNAINDKNLTNRTKELYFKYLRAFHTNEENQTDLENEEVKLINCQNRRILLIDDEADKGWKEVLGSVFKDAGDGFQVISDFSDIDKGIAEATKRATEENWDLILLDLRLNPQKEDRPDSLLKAENYSGAELLKVIKEYNKGIQVIMLTASNKAWNMKKILDLGADGYYIKESPEFNFSSTFTNESYESLKSDINVCFKSQYLRKVFNDKKIIETHLKSIITVGGGKGLESLNKLKMINEICEIQLPQSVALLSLAKKDEKYFVFAFLSYFKILEILNDYFIEYDEIQKVMKFKDNGSILNEYKYDSHSKKYVKLNKNYWDPYKTSTPTKLYNVIYEKLGFHPNADFKIGQLIYKSNKNRNDFIHPPDGLKSTKNFTKDDCIDISDLTKNIIEKLS